MKKKLIVFLSFIILFIAFINNYLSFKVWDYDFWWHIATGRYIVENKGLPKEDPFTFTSSLEENKTPFSEKRTAFLLKQYWLAQVILYKVYDIFKEGGIIIFRSLLLITTVLLVLWWFKKQRVDFYISFTLIFLIYSATLSFTGERPVLFTLLFSMITFIILENFRKKRDNSIYLLIPLILLWANMHGGYILGVALILAYVTGDIIDFVFLKRLHNKDLLLKTLKGSALAIIASFINPNYGTVFPLLLAKEGGFFTKNIQEYISPFILYMMKIRDIDWGYIFLIFLTLYVIIARIRKIPVAHCLLLTGLLFMSVSALRFMIYYVAIGSMIVGKEVYQLIKDRIERPRLLKDVLLLVMFISSLSFALGFIDVQKITFKKASGFSVPEGAAAFIKSNNIKGNIFCDMGSGGYLIWELYPENKVFIDTRALNGNALFEYSLIMNSVETLNPEGLKKGKKPLWERILDHYDIKIIVLNPMDAVGKVPPFIFSLLEHKDWVPVYTGIAHTVFIKNISENKTIIERYRLDKEAVLNVMIVRFSQLSIGEPDNPNFMISLGDVFYNTKRYDDALKAYEYADRRLPGIQYIKSKIEQTKEKIKKEEADAQERYYPY